MQVLSKEVILTSHVFGGFFLTNCFVKNDGQALRFSPSWFTWSLISTAAQATLPCYWVYLGYLNTQSTLPSYWNTNITTTVKILEFTCFSMTSVVVFVSNIRKYQCFVNFHKIVGSIEDTWSDIRHQPPKSKINIRILVAYVVTAVLVTYDVAIWGICTISNYENRVTITVCYVSYLTTIFRLTSTFVTFTEVTQYMSKSFKYISIMIEQELSRQYFGRLMENQYMPCIEISQQSSNSQKCEVESLMDIYWLLVDAVHQANGFYCDQLMATTSYLFFSIIFNLYYSVLTFHSGHYIEFIWTFIWALASISYLVVMVRSAAEVTKSAEKTTMTICKTIHKDIEPAMKTQLERFLHQVSNDKPTFCALHLFKIKSDILTKVAVAGSSKPKQKIENTFTYTWNKIQSGKGSIEIVSCVYDRLKNTNIEPGESGVKLFVDGCGGQNENSILILKKPGKWHFKFGPTKQFILNRSKSGNILLRGELSYNSDNGTSKTLTQPNKNPGQISPEKIVLRHLPKLAKGNDVKKLLEKCFGPNWNDRQDFNFYKLALNIEGQREETEEEEDEPMDGVEMVV
ncbi:hypothetical protein J6590_094318 [Homalodisca vitripennis]|nr:hypothetical protein J6590_094318 [Homalodisca vitripennis]